MFVLNPDPYSLPCYRIGPFQTRDLSINHTLPDSDFIDTYFKNRFSHREFLYTENGRQAINIALSHYKLNKDDVVSILTTTGNFYISGCVTKEIEKYCKWSRDILPETKIIFVNHEFGYPYPDLIKLRKYNLPIIEDSANSFFSQDKNNDIGSIGDFVIYSFPKMFPIQIGGLLVSNIPLKSFRNDQLDRFNLRHIKNVLSEYIVTEKEIINKRIYNYNYLKDIFESIGFKERFTNEPGSVPGVFMFRTEHANLDLPQLKNHFYAHGVQCSVFYGEESFFIPVHQTLSEQDMDYFFEVMRLFYEKSNL